MKLIQSGDILCFCPSARFVNEKISMFIRVGPSTLHGNELVCWITLLNRPRLCPHFILDPSLAFFFVSTCRPTEFHFTEASVLKCVYFVRLGSLSLFDGFIRNYLVVIVNRLPHFFSFQDEIFVIFIQRGYMCRFNSQKGRIQFLTPRSHLTWFLQRRVDTLPGFPASHWTRGEMRPLTPSVI